MSTEPHGTTIFCDDIRQEVGNKISLMGIFQGDMIVHASFPATLNKLVLYITYSEALSDPRQDMTLTVYMPGDLNDKPTYSVPVELAEDQSTAESPELRRQLRMQFVLAPLTITEPGTIRVALSKGGRITKLGSIGVRGIASA